MGSTRSAIEDRRDDGNEMSAVRMFCQSVSGTVSSECVLSLGKHLHVMLPCMASACVDTLEDRGTTLRGLRRVRGQCADRLGHILNDALCCHCPGINKFT